MLSGGWGHSNSVCFHDCFNNFTDVMLHCNVLLLLCHKSKSRQYLLRGGNSTVGMVQCMHVSWIYGDLVAMTITHPESFVSRCEQFFITCSVGVPKQNVVNLGNTDVRCRFCFPCSSKSVIWYWTPNDAICDDVTLNNVTFLKK